MKAASERASRRHFRPVCREVDKRLLFHQSNNLVAKLEQTRDPVIAKVHGKLFWEYVLVLSLSLFA